MLGELVRCKAAELAGRQQRQHTLLWLYKAAQLCGLAVRCLYSAPSVSLLAVHLLGCRAPFKCKTTQLLARPRRENSTLDEGREGQGDGDVDLQLVFAAVIMYFAQ